MTTGERIKALRLSKGMSQEELGAAVGVKKAAINKYENGIVVNLKRSTIAKLADALETTPSYLMGWAEEIVRDISGIFNEEKTATPEGDGLSDEDIEIIELLRAASPAKKAALLALLKE